MSRRGFQRRALSLTPLVDVIFLLLLFFMLTSSFSRFGEIEISAAAAGTQAAGVEGAQFLRVAAETLRLAGRDVSLDALGAALEGETVLVALASDVTAQRLVDVLGTLRGVPGLTLQVLR
ncbi:biopolymer transporter ExbD [Salipiger sp. IMCC34102]|uniref:biopolymer transporter ExbD n=1 Tax=Salipiger sp. IMCC34102 TaxID=2510647 RepID=UPI00101D48AC|nr:biopolymer transporter ExbD [Salipiger sp. IMCC34102]RYH04474.1 biopolymer transporter ExbD [Salipiger sp. IMCC34102]